MADGRGDEHFQEAITDVFAQREPFGVGQVFELVADPILDPDVDDGHSGLLSV